MSTLGPILPGRIPESLSLSRLVERLRLGNAEIQRLQDQAATGQKFQLPGESPAAAIRALFLQSQIERKGQLQANVDAARSNLVLTETALATVGDGLNRAKSLIVAGTGDQVSDTERQVIAEEIRGILDGLVDAANTKLGDRYLFGGSLSGRPPFDRLDASVVRYNGDAITTDTFVGIDLLAGSNVDGATAFGAFNTVTGGDLDPALELDTRLADLRGGLGVPLGPIEIVVDDGTNPVQTVTLDLSGARTVRDLKVRIENAFAAGPATVTVDVDPGTNFGLRIQQSGGAAGTVTVNDLAGSRVARDLGLLGSGTEINGGDLDPRLSIGTTLAALNGGTGIGPTAGTGLRITSGDVSVVVDLDGAVTVQDLFQRIEAVGFDLSAGFSADGSGLAISSRRSGVSLSIGENGGTNATSLGLRTLTGGTPLGDLNLGAGVPNNETDLVGTAIPARITINRRDGTTSIVDLTGLSTVQQVLDAITAVDANFTASLAASGNGIALEDLSGAGPLEVEFSPLADALGIVGVQAGAGPLVGEDVNPRTSGGVFDTLLRIEAALRGDDRPALERLDADLNAVVRRFNAVRGEVGSRLRLLESTESRLLDEEVYLEESLSKVFDADLAEIVTQLTALQFSLQATMQIAASTQQLTILSFL